MSCAPEQIAMLACKVTMQSEAADNNQKFNQLLNSSKDPRAMYNALLALAPLIKEMRKV